MATTFMENLMKMIAQEILAAVMRKALGKDEVLTDAKIAAANTYKAISSIPYVGPFLAPPAAAAAFAAVMAFGSFQRGGVTEGETIGHLHPKEMVLPEHISTPLVGMLDALASATGRSLPVIAGSAVASLAGGGKGISVPPSMAALHGGGAGGGIPLPDQVSSMRRELGRTQMNVNKGGPTSVAISLQAWDGDSVDRWFRNGGDSLIADAVKRGVRQGRISVSTLTAGR
jgi:hypothetical protein